MANDVVFDVIARDRASNTFSKVGRNAKSSESQISKFGSTAKKAFGALVAFQGIKTVTTGLIGMAKAAAEDQTSVALLAKQMKNSAHATSGQIAQTERYVDALGRTKGITDDVARGSLGTLISATHDVTKAQQLNNLAVDIAAAKGKPLAATAALLTRAYNGNLRGLIPLGIKTKDAADKAITFANAQQQLTKQFGGAAMTKAKTFTGVMDRFHVVVNEAGEAVGYRLLPQLTKIVPKVSKFITGLQDGTGKGGEFAATVKTEVVPVLQNLGREAKLVFGAAKPFLDLLSKLPPQAIAFGGAAGFLGMKLGSLRAPLAANATGFAKMGRGLSSLAGGAGLLGLADASNRSNKALGGLEGAVSGAAVGLAVGGPLGAGIGFVGGGLLGIFSSGNKAGNGIDAVGAAAARNAPSVAALRDVLNQTTGAFTRLSRKTLGQQLIDAKQTANIQNLGLSLDVVTSALNGNAKAGAKVQSVLKAATSVALEFNQKTGKYTNSKTGKIVDTKTAQSLIAANAAAVSLQQTMLQLGGNTKTARVKLVELSLANGKFAKSLKGIPDKKVLKIAAEGAAKARGDIIDLAARGKKLSDKQIRMLLKISGETDIQAALKRIKAAADRAAKTRTILFKTKVTGSTNANLGELGANGDNTRQTSRTWMQDIAAQISKGTPKVKVALDRAKSLFQQFTDKVNSLKDTKSGFMSTFTSDSIFGADSETTGGTLSGLLQFQQKQATDASTLLNDIKSLTSRGLSKGLISQLQASGSAGAAQLHLLAGGSAEQISQFNALNAQTTASNQAAGLVAGNFVRGGNIDSDIRAAQQNAALTQAIIKALGHMKLETKVSGKDLIVVLRAEAKSSGVPTTSALTRG